MANNQDSLMSCNQLVLDKLIGLSDLNRGPEVTRTIPGLLLIKSLITILVRSIPVHCFITFYTDIKITLYGEILLNCIRPIALKKEGSLEITKHYKYLRFLNGEYKFMINYLKSYYIDQNSRYTIQIVNRI